MWRPLRHQKPGVYRDAVPLFLVRHAKAGNRSAWIGDDTIRPITESGLRQAEAIADRLAPLSPTALLSSPYLRCVQTLEPLAERTGLTIEVEGRIGEESPLERALAALEDAPDNAVLCSHGDVIPEVVDALIRRGMTVGADMVAPRKGSVIVLHHVNGLFTRAEYWGPPSTP